MITVAHIFRFPVKGLGEEDMASAELETGQGLPGDRKWAIAHGKSPWDAANPQHISRRHFVQTADTPTLARSATRLEGESEIIASHPDHGDIRADLATEAGAQTLCDWALGVAGDHQAGPYSIARVDDQPMWDVAGAHLSLMSTNALKILSEKAGQPIEMRRFRGNIWLDGFAPGEEYDLIGQEITIGGLRLRVTEETGRCAAPGASPASGRRDIEMTKLLHDNYGHTNFGVYAEVIGGGRIALGDALSL